MRRVLIAMFLAVSDVCEVIAAELRPKRKRARRRKRVVNNVLPRNQWDNLK